MAQVQKQQQQQLVQKSQTQKGGQRRCIERALKASKQVLHLALDAGEGPESSWKREGNPMNGIQ